MIPIMPKHQPAVCEMPLNGAKDCVTVESLRCPYCLAPVEIRQGDNWVAYWCSQHGAIEHPISFTDTALADRPGNSPPCRMSAASWYSRRSLLAAGFFVESSRMRPAAMSLFQLTNLITTWPGASREGSHGE